MLRFGIAGTIGFVVDAAIVEGTASYLGPIWARLLGFPVAIIVTWLLNRRYTFPLTEYGLLHEFLRYAVANLAGWLANNCLYYVLVLNSPHAQNHPVLAVASGSLAGMALNFSGSKWLVFRRSSPWQS